MSITVATLDDVRDIVGDALARRDGVYRTAWTVAEAAQSLGTSPDTVRRLIREGHLSLVPHMGTRQLIPVAALEAFVSAGAVGAAGDTLPSSAASSGPSGANGTDRRGGGSVSPLRSAPADQQRAGGPSSTAGGDATPPAA